MIPSRIFALIRTPLSILTCLMMIASLSSAAGIGDDIECVGSIGEGITVMALQGHYLYAAGGFTLHILDIAEPAKPKEVGWLRMGYRINTVDVYGPAVYLGTEDGGGLQVVDVSDPTRPRCRTLNLSLDEYLHSFTLRTGHYLYFKSRDYASRQQNFEVLDIRDPFHPKSVHNGRREDHVHASFATDGERLLCINVLESEKGNLKIAVADQTTTPGRQLATYTMPDRAVPNFIFKPENRILAYGDEDSSSPLEIMRFNKLEALSTAYGREVEVHGDWLLHSDHLRMTVFSQSVRVPVISDLHPEHDESDLHAGFNNVLIHGNSLYVLNDHDIRMFDLSAPGKARERTPLVPLSCSEYHGPLLGYEHCAIVLRLGGVAFYDISKPFEWRQLATWGGAIQADLIKVADRKAYIIGPKSLSVVDCADPSRPTLLANDALPMEEVKSCAFENECLYAADQQGRICVVNVARPTSPTLQGVAHLPLPPSSLAASGQNLYAASGEAGLVIYDISQPANPTQKGRYKTERPCWDLVTSGTLLYALTQDALEIIDAQDVAHPVLRSRTPVKWDDEDKINNPIHVCIKRLGNVLYLIQYHQNRDQRGAHYYYSLLKVVDVSNPAAPRVVGKDYKVSCDEENAPKSVADSRPITHTSGWLLGLPTCYYMLNDKSCYFVLFDLSIPEKPVPVGVCTSFHDSYRTECLYKNQLYKADGEGGLLILKRAEHHGQ